MRPSALSLICVLILGGCSPYAAPPVATKKAAAPAAPAAPKPVDQTRRFPSANRVSVTLVETPLFGKPFLPGGNVAKYKRGAREYEMFLIRAGSPDGAAGLLFEYKSTLENPMFIAHFGGFSGADAGTPTFLFSKGSWLAGIRGLPEADADTEARELAGRLDVN